MDSFHEPKDAAQPVAPPPVPTRPIAPAMPAQPMLHSGPQPVAQPLSEPEPAVQVNVAPLPEVLFEDDLSEIPSLSQGSGTVVVGHPQQKKSRWPVLLLAAAGVFAIAGAVGYLVGNGGSGPQAPGAAAGAAPALAQDETDTETQAAVAVTGDVVATQAEEAVADTPTPASGPVITELAPEQTFDAGFDIIVEPAGARVFLDGKELGPAPLRIGRLASGAHVVDITAPDGYENQRVELDLESGEREVVRVTLDPVAAEEPVAEVAPEPVVREKTESKRKERRSKRVAKKSSSSKKSTTSKAGQGTLMLGAKPPCKIYIDGKNTGLVTPQRALSLSAGKHKVTLVNAEHKIRVSTTVTIEAGKTKRLIKDMSSRL